MNFAVRQMVNIQHYELLLQRRLGFLILSGFYFLVREFIMKRRQTMEMKEDYHKNLSEDSDIRLVNIHLHRFARFIRFLKHKDITIQWMEVDEEGNKTKKSTFTSDGVDECHSIKDLLSIAINIPSSYWDTLTTRKLGLDDVHTDGDRKTPPGKVIEAITFNLSEMESLSSDQGSYLLAKNPFSIRSKKDLTCELFEPYKSMERDQRPRRWTHYLGDVYTHLSVHTAEILPEIDGVFNMLRVGEKIQFNPFIEHAIEVVETNPDLEFQHGNTIVFNNARSNDLLRIIKRVINYFVTFSTKSKDRKSIYYIQQRGENAPEPEATLLPGYWDFYFPHNKQATLEHIRKNGLKTKLIELDEHDLHELIEYRYEILWLMEDLDYAVSDWTVAHQALLFLVLAEYKAAHGMLRHAAEWVVEDLRFTILTSNGEGAPSYQKSALDLDTLCDFLTEYNFLHGLKESIKISGLNLLGKPMYMFPDPDAVVEKYNKDKIRKYMEEKLVKHFFNRVREDLYIDKSMTY